ncbi:MAG: hypothetical protein NUV93_04650 [Firmicutes bacterium]|nr:hypothetical protein [Bacillota bacterium]
MKQNWKSLAPVAVLILLALFIRIFVQKGAKPLRDVHPWDYILMVATILVAGWYLYRLYHGTSSRAVQSK